MEYSYRILLYNIVKGGGNMMDVKFIRTRITQLRLQKGVSEYRMSYDLGHSRSYIYNISSGKSLPLMQEFLQICEYFGITPAQFFEESIESPALWQEAIETLRRLDAADLALIVQYAHRLGENR